MPKIEMAIVFSLVILGLRIVIWPFLVHCIYIVKNDLKKMHKGKAEMFERRKTATGAPIIGRRKEDRQFAYARY